MVAGTTDNTSLSFNLSAPKNNGTFTAFLTFSTENGTSIGIGTASTQINLTSVSNQFVTTGNSGDTKPYPITVSVGADVLVGTYYFKAVPTSTGGPSGNSSWSFTVIVGSGSTSGSVQSVTAGAQSGTVVYGSTSTATYNITSARGGNGTVNGTYSVSGLPSGVTSSFTTATFSSTGGNVFPGTTLTLNIPATVPAGLYSFSVSLSDGTNLASSTANLFVDKADAIIVVSPYNVPYNGNPHTSAATASGVEMPATDLSSLLNLTTTVHTNAGTYADEWTFVGDNNYKSASGTVKNVINKADATLNIVGYTGIYDGNPHQASGTASGVKNEDLSSLLSFGAGITEVPGGNATYSFSGNGNYNAASGTVPIV
jgi:hypothetical protein